MDSHRVSSFSLFLIFSLICSLVQADGSGSVFFLDSPTHPYLRSRSWADLGSQTDSLLLSDVSAAVSVLLGVAPQGTLSASSSSKLNEILAPNPFYRPRTVFVLELSGAEDSELVNDAGSKFFGSALKSKVIFGESKADILLSDEVFVTSLNEHLSFDAKAQCTDKDLSDFASWAGGSYASDASETSNGEMIVPLASGEHLNLHLSKKADRDFILGLFSLIRNTEKTIQLRKDLSGRDHNLAELISGKFDGIKALKEQYGSGVAQQGVELFVALFSRMFNSLQSAYEGHIVGVVLNELPLSEVEMTLKLMPDPHPYPRWLGETKGSSKSNNTGEQILVRQTVAWITGIMLIIATLLGILFLLNMPLTRDTLLYSNVKLE